jgi:hypothetical protein
VLDEEIQFLMNAEAPCGPYSWSGGVGPAMRVSVIDRGTNIMIFTYMTISIPAAFN